MENNIKVPFNIPVITGREKDYLDKAVLNGGFSGNGEFSKACCSHIEDLTGCRKAIMTSSCTDALEMTSLLSVIEPGDEVIMPSFTFVTTASAFVLRKAKIVWCDIRPDTKNIDEDLIEDLITERTKAVVVVHYAGVACEMDKISEICRKHGLFLIEDAAQAIGSAYKGRPLGSIGDLGTLSFHETKNIHCGEGGALLVNVPELVERAEFIRDKGTNRSLFNKGIVDKYTWVELGSSYLMSELQAAFLLPQLESFNEINRNRLNAWNMYYKGLSGIIQQEHLQYIPEDAEHNAHMFYIMTRSFEERKELIGFLHGEGINAIFHYIPLHQAPYWKGMYDSLQLNVTQDVSKRILRLPLFNGITAEQIDHVCNKINEFYGTVR